MSSSHMDGLFIHLLVEELVVRTEGVEHSISARLRDLFYKMLRNWATTRGVFTASNPP
jgi:hypothetical protein